MEEETSYHILMKLDDSYSDHRYSLGSEYLFKWAWLPCGLGVMVWGPNFFKYYKIFSSKPLILMKLINDHNDYPHGSSESFLKNGLPQGGFKMLTIITLCIEQNITDSDSSNIGLMPIRPTVVLGKTNSDCSGPSWASEKKRRKKRRKKVLFWYAIVLILICILII